MKKERIMYLDALRVFSIFAVVLLHICAMDWYTADVTTSHWQALNLYDGMVRFCVPVFIMISGAFFLAPEKNYTIKDIFTKKILRVLVAFLFWSFVYLVCCKDVKTSGTMDFIYKWLTGSRYHLWFPFTIISLYIISPFLREICKNRRLCEYFLVLWFLGSSVGTAVGFIPNVPQVVTTLKSYLVPQFVLGYPGYFVLGYYLSRYELSKKVHYISYVLAVLGAAATVAGTAYMSLKAGDGYSRLYEYIMPNNALVSAGVFLFFKSVIKNDTFGEAGNYFISLLSHLTFGIYLVHEMFIYIIEKEMNISTGVFNPFLSVPALGFIVFVLSAAVVFIISKIPILNKYIM